MQPTSSRNLFWLLQDSLLKISAASLLAAAAPVAAQVVGTPAGAIVGTPIGANGLGTLVNGSDGGSCISASCIVTGGTQNGENLFHRFSQFDTRGAITGVSIDALGSRNLIVGVTNPLGSFIDKPVSVFGGAIGAAGQVNLYWLSPGGIAISGAGSFQNIQNLNLSTATRLTFLVSSVDEGIEVDGFDARLSSVDDVVSDGLGSFPARFVTDIPSLPAGLARNGDISISDGLLVISGDLLLDAQGGNVLFRRSRLDANNLIARSDNDIIVQSDAGVSAPVFPPVSPPISPVVSGLSSTATIEFTAGRSIVVEPEAGLVTSGSRVALIANADSRSNSPLRDVGLGGLTISSPVAASVGSFSADIFARVDGSTSPTTAGLALIDGSIESNRTGGPFGDTIVIRGSAGVELGPSAFFSSDNLVLSTLSIDARGGAFTNRAGPGVFGAFSWLVISDDPRNDLRGDLAFDFKQYNVLFNDSGFQVTPTAQAGNGFLYTLAPSLSPVISGVVSKVFDATPVASVASVALGASGDLIDGDFISSAVLSGAAYTSAGTGIGISDPGEGKRVEVFARDIEIRTLVGPGQTAPVYGYLTPSSITPFVGEQGVITSSAGPSGEPLAPLPITPISPISSTTPLAGGVPSSPSQGVVADPVFVVSSFDPPPISSQTSTASASSPPGPDLALTLNSPKRSPSPPDNIAIIDTRSSLFPPFVPDDLFVEVPDSIAIILSAQEAALGFVEGETAAMQDTARRLELEDDYPRIGIGVESIQTILYKAMCAMRSTPSSPAC